MQQAGEVAMTIKCPTCVGSGEVLARSTPTIGPYVSRFLRKLADGEYYTCPACGGSGKLVTP